MSLIPHAMPTLPNASAPAFPVGSPAESEIDHKAAMERLLTTDLLSRAQNSAGETLLMLAARAGDAELVRILAAKSNRLAASSQAAGETPLSLAAAGGHVECVKILLEEKPREQCERSSSWQHGELRAIDRAIGAGRWDCVRLIAPFTDLNDRGTSSARRLEPLFEAARQGRLDMLLFLEPLMRASGKASRSATENWLESALDGAAGSHAPGAVDCLDYLTRHPMVHVAQPPEDGELLGGGGGALFRAISADIPKNAIFLLPFFGSDTARESCRPGASENNFFTPLAWAVLAAAEKTVEALLPLCEQSLRETEWASDGSRVSKILVLALKEAADRTRWDANQPDRISRAWRIVDAVGAKWAQVAGLGGHPSQTHDRLTQWVAETKLSDERWRLAPRWRASLEAAALSGELAQAAPANASAEPAPGSENGGQTHKAARL